MVFPAIKVDDPKIINFEDFWKTKLDKNLASGGIMNQVIEKKLTGLYVMGENPAKIIVKLYPPWTIW